MDNRRAFGLALLIAGAAGGIMYYLYMKKVKGSSATPPVEPSVTPPSPTNLGRAQVRNVAERFSNPAQSSGIAGRTNMGAVQGTAIIRNGQNLGMTNTGIQVSNLQDLTPNGMPVGRYSNQFTNVAQMELCRTLMNRVI